MASNSNSNWIVETVGDFIHSRIWHAPIRNFIEEHCATFDYDDDEEEENESPTTSMEEQLQIHRQYQRLVDSLINGLGHDLSLDDKELKQACQLPSQLDSSTMIDESFEQLYAARDFQLFQEMMRRKNLILQLQALVSLQLQWGLLKQSDTGDDLVLSLLLQATKSPSRRESIDRSHEEIPHDKPTIRETKREEKPVQHEDDDDDDVVVVPTKTTKLRKERVEPEKPVKESYRLPDLRRKEEMNVDWHRNLRAEQSKRNDDDNEESSRTSNSPSITTIPGELLREKLRELTDRTTASVDDETAAKMKCRSDFLRQQRDLLVKKQRAERKQDLEEQTRNARPQSAAYAARKAMTKTNENQSENQTKIDDDELAKRRATMDKLKRVVIDKR